MSEQTAHLHEEAAKEGNGEEETPGQLLGPHENKKKYKGEERKTLMKRETHRPRDGGCTPFLQKARAKLPPRRLRK